MAFIIKRIEQTYFALVDDYRVFDEQFSFYEQTHVPLIPRYDDDGSFIGYPLVRTRAFYPTYPSKLTRIFNAIIYGEQYKIKSINNGL